MHVTMTASAADYEWFKALVGVPVWRTPCGEGWGIAASTSLGIVATTDIRTNTISLFQLPGHGSNTAANGFRLTNILGKEKVEPFNFHFQLEVWFPGRGRDGGGVAFGANDVLFVADSGHSSVHMIDVVHETHLGFVGAAGGIFGPVGVDAKMDVVAISCWGDEGNGPNEIRVFRHTVGSSWVLLSVISMTKGEPQGLRLFQDCGISTLIVVDAKVDNDFVHKYCIVDKDFVHKDTFTVSVYPDHPEYRFSPMDVEIHRGLLMVTSYETDVLACFDYQTQKYIGCIDSSTIGVVKNGFLFSFQGLAVMPGLGLLVRNSSVRNSSETEIGHIQVLATPDDLAMVRMMSFVRVAWMACVYRGIQRIFHTAAIN